MNRMKEIRQLRRAICAAQKGINQIQRECKHNRIRHRMSPNQYCMQGHSKECVDCGLSLGVSSYMPDEETVTKTWIERVKA